MGIFCLDQLIHVIPYRTGASAVHEVAHIDGGTVDELSLEVLIFHHPSEQAGVLIVIGPRTVGVVVGVVNPLDAVIAGGGTIKADTEVGVFGDKAPPPFGAAWSPHHDIVAGEVLIVVIQVHHHQIDKLLPVYPLCVFF